MSHAQRRHHESMRGFDDALAEFDQRAEQLQVRIAQLADSLTALGFGSVRDRAAPPGTPGPHRGYAPPPPPPPTAAPPRPPDPSPARERSPVGYAYPAAASPQAEDWTGDAPHSGEAPAPHIESSEPPPQPHAAPGEVPPPDSSGGRVAEGRWLLGDPANRDAVLLTVCFEPIADLGALGRLEDGLARLGSIREAHVRRVGHGRATIELLTDDLHQLRAELRSSGTAAELMDRGEFWHVLLDPGG